MSVKVLVAKYIPDRRRNEPRNVGVLVAGENGAGVARFLGQVGGGAINGRRVPRNLLRDLEAYKLWVSYWQDAAKEGLDALRELDDANTSAYYVVEAGEIVKDPQLDDIEALADRYFRELVDEIGSHEKTSASLALSSAVERLISNPAIEESVSVKRDYSVEYPYHGGIVNMSFQYGFINGHVTVGQRVLLGDEPHAFSFLGKAQNLPEEYGPSVAFVLSDEFEELKDDSGVYWLLDDHCKVIQADLETAVVDLAAAIAD